MTPSPRTKASPRRCIQDILITAGILAAATGICLLLDGLDSVDHGDAYVSMVYILAVLLVSRFTDGYWYGITASLLGVLAVNYFFTYPYFAFNFTLPGYPITIVCMLTVTILTCALTTRIKLQEEARREADREIIRGNLLRAISHDLRTPLTSILGANSVLMENEASLSAGERLHLHKEIEEDAQWLIRMVENLLTITRIRDDRAAKIEKQPEAVEEVLAEAVNKFQKRFPNRAVAVRVPEALLLCPMDAMLIEQVLLNLMENIVEHAESATLIQLTAAEKAGDVLFTVEDNGKGLRKETLAQLFRGSFQPTPSESDAKRNMGIGLSVCNAIVLAHGGTMSAGERPGGGLIISFVLPGGGEHDE